MALYNNNMQEVPAPDDLVPEGPYHVRVASYEEKESSSGKPMLVFQLKIQDEGPAFGRVIPLFCSLEPNALFNLKGLYKGCNYNPGPEGHDPDNIVDCELYVTVKHDVYEGEKRIKIPPYSMRSLEKGPAVPKGSR